MYIANYKMVDTLLKLLYTYITSSLYIYEQFVMWGVPTIPHPWARRNRYSLIKAMYDVLLKDKLKSLVIFLIHFVFEKRLDHLIRGEKIHNITDQIFWNIIDQTLYIKNTFESITPHSFRVNEKITIIIVYFRFTPSHQVVWVQHPPSRGEVEALKTWGNFKIYNNVRPI